MSDPFGLGPSGEDAAARYLVARGLRVVQRHYQTRWGEIDLVCHDGDTYVFVEVKTRLHHQSPAAIDSITVGKQKRIVRAALAYVKHKGLTDEAMRFDVVTIEAGEVTWYQGAYEAPASYTL